MKRESLSAQPLNSFFFFELLPIQIITGLANNLLKTNSKFNRNNNNITITNTHNPLSNLFYLLTTVPVVADRVPLSHSRQNHKGIETIIYCCGVVIILTNDTGVFIGFPIKIYRFIFNERLFFFLSSIYSDALFYFWVKLLFKMHKVHFSMEKTKFH